MNLKMSMMCNEGNEQATHQNSDMHACLQHVTELFEPFPDTALSRTYIRRCRRSAVMPSLYC